jgi:hypothetical protein
MKGKFIDESTHVIFRNSPKYYILKKNRKRIKINRTN